MLMVWDLLHCTSGVLELDPTLILSADGVHMTSGSPEALLPPQQAGFRSVLIACDFEKLCEVSGVVTLLR